MQIINLKPTVAKAAAVISFKKRRSMLYQARLVMGARMAGYPRAIHVIGQLQSQFKLDSYQSLLESVLKVRNIAAIAADVLDSIDGAPMSKFALNKTDIIAYINLVVRAKGIDAPSSEDVELIAFLISSYEANVGSWMLDGGVPDDNLHVKMMAMYATIASSDSSSSIPYYNAAADVVELVDTKKASAKANKAKKVKAELDEPSMDDTEDDNIVILSIAAIRVIDHIYQLMTERDVWYHFITPRTSADAASNVERAKGLKLLATYLQSILSYSQYFTIELFLRGYGLIEDWITHFPDLTTETMKNIEQRIRPFDFLNARTDVANLISSLKPDVPVRGVNDVIVFPAELLGSFGLRNAISELADKSTNYSVSLNLDNIPAFDDSFFAPLLSGISVGKFRIVDAAASAIIIGKVVSNVVDRACVGLTQNTIRGTAHDMIRQLSALGISCSIPFAMPTALEIRVRAGVRKVIENNQIRMDSGAVNYSLAYHEMLRNELKYICKTGDVIFSMAADRQPGQYPDMDRAELLRELAGHQWQSVYPADWFESFTVYDTVTMNGSLDLKKQFFQKLFPSPFDIWSREMANENLREVYATWLSSFALVYVDASWEGGMGAVSQSALGEREPNLSLLKLVLGYGFPYGTTYEALAALQNPIVSKDQLIHIREGVYIALLNVIPIVTDKLTVDPSFANEYPVMFYAANSAVKKVDKWVLGPGLLQFALVPNVNQSSIPSLMITNRAAFINNDVYINLIPWYKPSAPEDAAEVVAVNVQTSVWPYDRNRAWLDYNHFGKYASPDVPSIPELETEDDVTKVLEKIEAASKAEQDRKAKEFESTGKHSEEQLSKAEKEVSDQLPDIKIAE